jgi:hypothetical protein
LAGVANIGSRRLGDNGVGGGSRSHAIGEKTSFMTADALISVRKYAFQWSDFEICHKGL